MIEFVGSKEILDFAKEEGFETIRMTFEDKNPKRDRDSFNVFEISEEEFEKMCDYEDENGVHIVGEEHPMIWKDHWGWWRYATGCALEDVEPTIYAFINNNELKVWYSSDKMRIDITDWIEDGDPEPLNNLMGYWIAEHSKYPDLFRYCIDMWGVSTEQNITAVAVGLAKLNNMKLSDLFKLSIAL